MYWNRRLTIIHLSLAFITYTRQSQKRPHYSIEQTFTFQERRGVGGENGARKLPFMKRTAYILLVVRASICSEQGSRFRPGVLFFFTKTARLTLYMTAYILRSCYGWVCSCSSSVDTIVSVQWQIFLKFDHNDPWYSFCFRLGEFRSSSQTRHSRVAKHVVLCFILYMHSLALIIEPNIVISGIFFV